MCFEDFKPRTLNTAISGVKSFAKNNGKQMAFSSRNHLKIQEHVGLSLGNLLPLTAFRFMSLRSTLNSLIPKMSGGPISPGDCNINTALKTCCFERFLFLWSIAPNGPYPESGLTDFKLHQTHLKRDPVKFKASSRSAYLLRDNHGRVALQVTSLQIKQKGLMHYLWMMCLKILNGA